MQFTNTSVRALGGAFNAPAGPNLIPPASQNNSTIERNPTITVTVHAIDWPDHVESKVNMKFSVRGTILPAAEAYEANLYYIGRNQFCSVANP